MNGPETSLDTWVNKRLIALIGSVVLIATFYQAFGTSTYLVMATAAIVLVFYLYVIWNRKIKWNVIGYGLACAIICLITVYFHYKAHLNTGPLVWPLLAIIASLPQTETGASVIMATICVAVSVIVSYTYTFPWGTLLGMSGMYAMIRSRRVRQEAQRLRELHLQELHQAHEELKHAHAELEEASVHSIRYAALAERSRIASEVHDVVGHNLTTLIVQLQALEYMIPVDPNAAADLVPKMLQVARTGMNEVRTAVGDWATDETGLGVAALQGLISQVESQAGLQIAFEVDGDGSEWPMNTSVVLYRVLQECLTNVLRYAGASSVRVHIIEVENEVHLSVSDDGCYTGNPPIQPGFGIRNMLNRCQSVGGTCTFDVHPPHGLIVKVSIPLAFED